MREFKFRAWIKKEKLMVSVPQYNINSFYGWNDKKTIIMQYTGLKDKNDVDIYEGDILNCFGDIAVVYYDNSQALFRYRYKSGDEIYMEILGTHEYDHFKVIGNIYENKDLLES